MTITDVREMDVQVLSASKSPEKASERLADNADNLVPQLPTLFAAARLEGVAPERPRLASVHILPPAQSALLQALHDILERSVELQDLQPRVNSKDKEACRSYLRQLTEAYYRLFPRCLAGSSRLVFVKQALVQTVRRLLQIPIHVIQEDYDRLNRNSYNLPLKQLVLAFSRPEVARRSNLPTLSEGECLLALFIQFLRQQMGAEVLFSDAFQVEYHELLRSMSGLAQEADLGHHNLTGWLWEAMRSFDPLKAFSASGHGRTTFAAWVRTVVNNKLADEKRKLLKREADELLFYEARAVQIFQDRYQALQPAVQSELDFSACVKLIQLVQTEVTDPKVRASTNRLRQRIAEHTGWNLPLTREIHQQVRRVLGRYVQSTRSLNITSTDSNQEWIDNYPDARTLPNPDTISLDCMTEFLQDEGTPTWVRDWSEKRRTQAEIARELFVSQPTISRLLGREYRLWLYRKFFRDAQTPDWMKQWHETQAITSPHRRRQLRREIYPRYALNLDSARVVDDLIESKLTEWCQRNGINHLA